MLWSCFGGGGWYVCNSPDYEPILLIYFVRSVYNEVDWTCVRKKIGTLTSEYPIFDVWNENNTSHIKYIYTPVFTFVFCWQMQEIQIRSHIDHTGLQCNLEAILGVRLTKNSHEDKMCTMLLTRLDIFVFSYFKWCIVLHQILGFSIYLIYFSLP